MTGSSRARVSRLLRPAAGLLVLAGLAAMLWAGLSATPFYSAFEPRSPCLVHGFCDPAVVDAGQRTWWLRSALATLPVLAGLAAAVLLRPVRAATDDVAVHGSSSPWRRSVGAGLVAAALLALGALPLALAGLAAPQLGAAVLAWLLVTQAWVLDWYAAHAGPLAARPRLRLAGTVLAAGTGWLAGAGIAAAAGATSVASGALSLPAFAAVLVAVAAVDGIVVTLVVRALLASAQRVGRQRDADVVGREGQHGEGVEDLVEAEPLR